MLESRRWWGILFLLLMVGLYDRNLWQKGSQNMSLLHSSHILRSENASQYADVEAVLRDVKAQPPSDTVLRSLGLLLAATGRENEFDAVWHEAGFPVTDMLYWGETARQERQYETALAWYARALRANPAWADPWYYKGVILEGRQQKREALAAFEQAALADEYTRIGVSDVYARMGRLYQSFGENQLALTSFETALAQNDYQYSFSQAIALNGKAAALIRVGNYEPAIQLLEDAIVVDRDYEWSYIRLGKAYEACCGNQTAALQYLQEAIRLNPGNKWAYLTAGDVYAAHGRLPEAQQMYEQALNLDPDWEEARTRLSE